MKNDEAADVLREYIRTNKPCNGLETALQKAITALEHQPEPQPTGEPLGEQCDDCGAGIRFGNPRQIHATCRACGSTNLRPVFEYVSEIGRKA